MNKKYILYLPIVVTVILTNSRYAFASFFLGKTYDVAPKENVTNNVVVDAAVDAVGNGIDTIGLITGKYPNKVFQCTGTIINTNNGNIGLTAGHCLYDPDKKAYPTDMYFYPGYDRGQGQAGGGKIALIKSAVLPTMKNNNPVDDYGMFKLDYKQGKLQSVTGAYNWDLNPPPVIPQATVFGYPKGGNMPCDPKDGQTFCKWQGQSTKNAIFRLVPVNVGGGSSGGPWLKDFNGNTKVGTIFGVTAVGVQNSHIDSTAAATWNARDFNAMLGYIQS